MDVHLSIFALNKKIRTSFNALYSREREADELLYIEWNSRMKPTNMLCRLRSMKFRQQKWSFERSQINALKCFLDTPAGAVLPIYDAMLDEPSLRHILVRHEQGAAHPAEGHARSSGKPSDVLVTSGPGSDQHRCCDCGRAYGFNPPDRDHGTRAHASHRSKRPISLVLQDRVQSTVREWNKGSHQPFYQTDDGSPSLRHERTSLPSHLCSPRRFR